ncbi:hypothetical protein GCM10009416_00230 [Craurococcus roseus]|uniref:Uncharacterized protein n=1 Tax=Craurococcus roseus TaxID=77585 RepID=A0ABN1EGN7_9PROT
MPQLAKEKNRAPLGFAAAVLGGLVFAGPAAAQEWGGAARHSHPDAAATWLGELDRAPDEAFERGYLAGRKEERRRRSAAAGEPTDAPEFPVGLAWNDVAQGEAMERLERAAADLRRSLVLMQRQPSLPRANGAIAEARQALVRVQNAMTWLPSLPERGADGRRYERLRGRGVGPERASGGWEG